MNAKLKEVLRCCRHASGNGCSHIGVGIEVKLPIEESIERTLFFNPKFKEVFLGGGESGGDDGSHIGMSAQVMLTIE